MNKEEMYALLSSKNKLIKEANDKVWAQAKRLHAAQTIISDCVAVMKNGGAHKEHVIKEAEEWLFYGV